MTHPRLLWTILAQCLVVTVAGGAVWWLVWALGSGKDTAWTLAAIVWIIGSPVIELIGVAIAKRG